MADVTGGTPPTGASPFRPPEDYKAVYDHFGDQGMFSVATASSLPASGNWPGRILTAADTGVVYVWRGSAWVRPFASGVSTLTSDSNGYLTITHGLGVTPVIGGAEICDDTPLVGNELKLNGGMMAANSTTFRVRVYRLQSGAFNAFALNPVKVAWWASA